MSHVIRPQRIDAAPPRRHDGRVRKVSSDPGRLRRLDVLVVDEHDAAIAVALVCDAHGVPEPRLRFHARRSMFTGATERPRHSWVGLLGEDEVAKRELNGWGALPPHGAIRLGRSTTLMTVAHELGHHLVFHLDPADTPSHGNRWIQRFDGAASVIAETLDI